MMYNVYENGVMIESGVYIPIEGTEKEKLKVLFLIYPELASVDYDIDFNDDEISIFQGNKIVLKLKAVY